MTEPRRFKLRTATVAFRKNAGYDYELLTLPIGAVVSFASERSVGVVPINWDGQGCFAFAQDIIARGQEIGNTD